MTTDDKHKNDEAVAHLYNYFAKRIDEIRKELFPKYAKATEKKEGGHGR